MSDFSTTEIDAARQRRETIATLMIAASQQAATGIGYAAIARNLESKGQDPALIEEALAALADDPPVPPTPAPARAAKPDGRAKTSADNGKQGGRPQSPPHADAANAFAADCLKTDGVLTTRFHHGVWLRYRPVAGWREVSEGDIEAALVTWLRAHATYRPHATANYARSVLLNLRAYDLCGIPETIIRPVWLDSMTPASNWMAFSCGTAVNVYDYATALATNTPLPATSVRPASALLFSSDFVSYPWQPDALPLAWHKFLDRVQPDPEQVAAIARMMGLLMVDETKHEVFWQLYGNGKNGKTVTLDIIRRLVGPHNVSAMPLTGLIERFQQWPLALAKANICGELPTDIGRGQFHALEGAFKDAVSGGEIEVEKKGADKYYAKCRARFVLSANSLPTFVDRSDAIWRRLRIIPYPVQIPEAERVNGLADIIAATDMPGIAAWALAGLADVIRLGKVPDCPAGEAHKGRHRANCDHERQFLTEHYQQDADGRTEAKALYDQFRGWMADNGYKATGAGKFYSRVEEVFPGCAYKKARVGTDLAWVIEGIRANVLGVA